MATVAKSKSRPAAKSRVVVHDSRGIKVVRACTIRRGPRELFAFWRDPENMMRIVKHPVTITRTADAESHWSVQAPAGRRVEWDAVVINERADELIAWRSQPGAEVPNAGSVRFDRAPGDEGTEVTISLEYEPPGGRVGAWVAKLTRDAAEQQVADALRRFKALMEAGEIPTTEGQPVGRPQKGKK